jgi:hypothetical protein
MLANTHIVVMSKLEQNKIDVMLKNEHEYITDLKIKEVGDPINI